MDKFTHLKPKTIDELHGMLSKLYDCDLHVLKAAKASDKNVVLAIEKEMKRRKMNGCGDCSGKPPNNELNHGTRCLKNVKR